MRSSITVFYIALIVTNVVAHAQDDPDALYRNRTTIADARSAAAIWESQLKSDPRNFDAAWKLARVTYWLGAHEPTDASRKALERGVEAARMAATLQPNRPEGHFWMAANMGSLAESFGLRQGLEYRGQIKEELETVLRLDPGFQRGSPDRALGRWYYKVPGLFGGSNKKSEEHLRKSLTYDANRTVSHFFLAETLLDLGRKADAIEQLKLVVAAPSDADWEPEDREYKVKAAERLSQLRR